MSRASEDKPGVLVLKHLDSGHFWYLGLFFCFDLFAGETMSAAFEVYSGHEDVERCMRRLAGIVDVPLWSDAAKRSTKAEQQFFQGLHGLLDSDERGDGGRHPFSELLDLSRNECPVPYRVIALVILAHLDTKSEHLERALERRKAAAELLNPRSSDPFLSDPILRMDLDFEIGREYRRQGRRKEAAAFFRIVVTRDELYRGTQIYDDSASYLSDEK